MDSSAHGHNEDKISFYIQSTRMYTITVFFRTGTGIVVTVVGIDN